MGRGARKSAPQLRESPAYHTIFVCSPSQRSLHHFRALVRTGDFLDGKPTRVPTFDELCPKDRLVELSYLVKEKKIHVPCLFLSRACGLCVCFSIEHACPLQ